MSGMNATTKEDILALAEDYDCTVVFATPKELLIDYDHVDEDFVSWDKAHRSTLEVIHRRFGIDSIATWPSRGGRLHIEVTLLDRVTRTEGILMEAALGSDPLKAVLDMRQEHRCLFKPKDGKPPEVYIYSLISNRPPGDDGGDERDDNPPF